MSDVTLRANDPEHQMTHHSFTLSRDGLTPLHRPPTTFHFINTAALPVHLAPDHAID